MYQAKFLYTHIEHQAFIHSHSSTFSALKNNKRFHIKNAYSNLPSLVKIETFTNREENKTEPKRKEKKIEKKKKPKKKQRQTECYVVYV